MAWCFPSLAALANLAIGAHRRRGVATRLEAAGEWAQAVAVPGGGCWRHCATTDCVKAALADGAVLAVVPLIFSSGKGAKANILLDAGTLAAVDEAAAAHGLTSSAFIASAALEKIRRGT